MAEPLLRIEGLTKRFGGLIACDGISLDIGPGEVHAVIGPNGAGKTTLVAQLGGGLRPEEGRVTFDGQDITRATPEDRSRLGIARSFQITSVFTGFSALDNVALAVQAHAGHSFRFWRPVAGDATLEDPARAALERIGLADRAGDPAGDLSHGERRQLELAMALVTEPRLLLLDEPTAGMGREDSDRMIALLEGLKGERAMLLVEHDMDAVFALADRITVMTYGKVIATDTPAAIRENEAVRAAYLGTDEAA
ncbi:MAG: ABC transporter ATP-binding protein [Rhodospirillaceae bacterium]|jgi:branched-chain amino acid transport system ATP-binding protein|nr:ABC transporter ATP-binding protein [Rhodospirillaceae bacterium]MBT6116463.1 ABC transporter ATP-binding protein [Rhodospirillaceae bacterium]